MKEREVPTKDLKTGAKVVKTVASSTFEVVKPSLMRSVERTYFKLRTSGKKIV